MAVADVLILASQDDTSALAVQAAVHAAGATAVVKDTSDFPRAWHYSAILSEDRWAIEIFSKDRDSRDPLTLDRIVSVYVRRPGRFVFPESLDSVSREFADVEAQAGVLGGLMALPVKWMNHPQAEMRANYKTAQLAIANRLGLDPPATLITNEIVRASQFISAHPGGVVYKEMGRYLSRVPQTLPVPRVRIVRQADLNASFAVTTNLLQERIPKLSDVRLTVIGSQMFAVDITAPPGTLDWRGRFGESKVERVDVPIEVEEKVSLLMAELQLAYAALDFAVDEGHAWRFLEINPNGQWLWLQRALRIPLSEAIAAVLLDAQV